MIDFLFFGILAYLLGSIPTAVWLGKSLYNLDVREHGSKNAGATNTFRVLGNKAGTIVLLIDVIKGVLAVTIPLFFIQSKEDHLTLVQLMTGVLVIIGHIFPLFAQFKGGKGVATSLGIIIGIYPLAALISFVLFLIVFLSSRFVSLGAIIASFFFPFIVLMVLKSDSIYLNAFSIILSLTVILTHRKNIKRLLNGTENKMNPLSRSKN
jgi:acyl phosphate:glycerol-3-phosphate acyltransferase